MSGRELDPDGTDSYHPQHPWEQAGHPLYLPPSRRNRSNWPPSETAKPAGRYEADYWANLPVGAPEGMPDEIREILAAHGIVGSDAETAWASYLRNPNGQDQARVVSVLRYVAAADAATSKAGVSQDDVESIVATGARLHAHGISTEQVNRWILREAREGDMRRSVTVIPAHLVEEESTREAYIPLRQTTFHNRGTRWRATLYTWHGIPMWIVREGSLIHRVFVGWGSMRRANRYIVSRLDRG